MEFVPLPVACFVGVLLTDLMYWQIANMMWADFSAWLVTVGMIVGYLAAITGIQARLTRLEGDQCLKNKAN